MRLNSCHQTDRITHNRQHRGKKAGHHLSTQKNSCLCRISQSSADVCCFAYVGMLYRPLLAKKKYTVCWHRVLVKSAGSYNNPEPPVCCWHAAICYTVCAITSSTAPSMKCDWWHHQIHHPLVFLSWLRCGTRDGVQLVSGPFIWVHKWLILSTPEKRVLQQSAAATTLMECCLQHLFLELHSKTALQHSPKQRQRIDRASCQKEKRKWLPPAHAVVQVSGDP